MKGDKIFMRQEQLQRFRVMGLVEAEGITLKDGGRQDGNFLPASQTDLEKSQGIKGPKAIWSCCGRW